MGKLHQLLAVIKDIRDAAGKITKETNKNFSDKVSLFDEEQKEFKAVKDESPAGGSRGPSIRKLMEMREGELSSHTALAETVASSLDHFAEHFGMLIDAEYQVDLTNTRATATLEIGGEKFENVPATFLLQFEKMLKTVRDLYSNIPTLDMKIRWERDEAKGKGIWRAPEEEKIKTTKETEHRVIVPATDHHPAQVAEYTNDVPVGVTKIFRWSGRITPEQKYRLLRKLDEMLRQVKKALGEANETQHNTEAIAEVFFRDLHSTLE